MDVNTPWAEDGGFGTVKNEFFNRAFVRLFHRVVSFAGWSVTTQCALSWLLPNPTLEANAAVDEICARIVPDEDG